MNGIKFAEAIYERPQPSVFQVRDHDGNKIAEFATVEEASYYLKNRDMMGTEVWIFDKTPGELLAIKPAKDFITDTETRTVLQSK